MQAPSSNDIRGIDVSRWQGNIDWASVKNAGIGLCYIKASEGTTIIDRDFEKNAEGAQNAGVKHGFYHFFTGVNNSEALAQAEYFAGVIGGYKTQARPVGELGYNKALTAQEFTDVCVVFMQRVEQLTGIKPMIYSSAYGARAYLLEPLNDYPLWVANYGVDVPESNPRWAEWTGFQYSDVGRIAGISTRVDLDYFTEGALIDETDVPVTKKSQTKYNSGVIYYTVQQGNTLSYIARRYGVTVAEIVSWNAIADPNLIYPGQVLRIYSTSDAIPSGGDILHVVIAGESLTEIARRYGVSVQALIDANDIANPNLIYPGQVLYIPRSSFISRPTTSSNPLDLTYTVQRGDTLTRIASRFNTTWRVLAQANGIPDPSRIYTGQILKITDTPLATSASSFVGYYKVQPGDTIQHIATRFNTSVAELRSANSLTSFGDPQTGRVLRIQPDGW